MTIIRIPTAGIPHVVSAKEMYAIPKPTDLMVWAVCPYLRDGERCKGCPDHYMRDGKKMHHGCRMMAAEVCRTVDAARAKS